MPATEMATDTLLQLALDALDELKAIDVSTLKVGDRTTVTDYMLIASGRSERHVRSLANNVATRAREAGLKPLGVEGESGGEWVLVDLADIVVHVMLPRVRDFYQLEKLWSLDREPGADDEEAHIDGLPQRGQVG